jgi:FG-GAP repeat
MRMLRSILTMLLISTSALCAPPQLAELTASDGNYNDHFGLAVAMSGSTVVVGAPLATIGSNIESGEAYVFVKPVNGWGNMTQVAKLTPTYGQIKLEFGLSVAVSGNTIVVGSSLGAYIFVKPASGWKDMTETAQIPGSGSVAISVSTIVSSTFQGGVNTVEVFLKPKAGWVTTSQPNAVLTPSDGTSNDQFGSSVAISGGTVVVGAPYGYSNNPGASYVFVQPANGWTNMTQTAKLTASNGSINNFFGQAVAINAGTIVVGAPVNYYYPPPTAYVFVQPLGGWANMTETAQLQGVLGGYPYFASSVAVSGNRIVVGEAGGDLAHSFQGACYIFTKPTTGWRTTTKYNAVLRASDDTGNEDGFGWSVAMSGGRILIGTDKFFYQQAGAAYVF